MRWLLFLFAITSVALAYDPPFTLWPRDYGVLRSNDAVRIDVDALTFDESTISEIPGYFGWDVTDIVQDMYNQQVLDTSDTGFGIAFYDTLFWADGQICESVGANISIFSREGNYGSAEQANGPKLVLWYECGEGDIPADTAQRPQLIYIND